MKNPWKLSIIGGSGRIACAVCADLVRDAALPKGRIILHGRSDTKLRRNLELISRTRIMPEPHIALSTTHDLRDAVTGADVVLYNATAGLGEYNGRSAFGIQQGAHILEIGEMISRLAPDAWLLVDTNPPDVPLMAARKCFRLKNVAALCNATDIFRKVLAPFLGCSEESLSFDELGLNHEVWLTDIRRDDVSIYSELRRMLPLQYDAKKLSSSYLDVFPEWPLAFRNNIALLEVSGFLSAPVGAPRRFRGLPVPSEEISGLMKRPTDNDFSSLVQSGAGPDKILQTIRRCGGGIPVYIARFLGSLLGGAPGTHSLQVPDRIVFPGASDEIMLQLTCCVSRGRIEATPPAVVPPFIRALLATRIEQNILLTRGLAGQDEALIRQGLLVCPERVDIGEASRIAAARECLEPSAAMN